MSSLQTAVRVVFVLSIMTICSVEGSFVNWENPHVSPLAMTPDGTRILAVNTPDNRLDVIDISTGLPVYLYSVPVGLDPVSVRARSNNEAWVVNHISDSVSIVDLASRNVIATLPTDDEPCDVVFAGAPSRAFVSCSQANTILVFDPNALNVPSQRIAIQGEDPRALAVSADGSEVYCAVFESGNGTTILGGGFLMGGAFPPNAVNEASGPYGGVNPPPNDGNSFSPPQNGANPAPPAVGMIVRKNAAGQWMDDNNGDWTDLVSGANADLSGRPTGWDLYDHDVAMINANTLTVDYARQLMNMCMSLSVNPGTGEVTLVGTDAINEVRFEPVVNGRFLRVNLARFMPNTPGNAVISDLNPHLDYTTSTIPEGQRTASLGDPRGIVWNNAGTLGYVTGMGSDNVIVIDGAGQRAVGTSEIAVGEGPTGIVLDESRSRLYVLNKFESSISVIDTGTRAEIMHLNLHDPSPAAIKNGRRHLYNTHVTSGLGHTSCASCHVDARMDRLAWDLGNPAGAMKAFNQNCGNGIDPNCQDWHPMKGPMTTQTLQDIIGKEPHHWRGDRDGIEEFNDAFVGLLGDDETLTANEMQQFEDFLATIHFPPNPFRNLDNTLPSNLPLPGHFTTGRFGPAGQPLPNGDAVNGLDLYRTAGLDGVECVSCHTLPTGMGSNYAFSGVSFQPMAPGPNGELHHALVSTDGSTNVSIKTPQLRNLYDKVGFETTQGTNLAGFGFLHDGSVDSIARFVSEPVFSVASDQEVADLVAFMLAFSGSDLPSGSPATPLELPGTASQDSHAAVGQQATLPPAAIAGQIPTLSVDEMIAMAESGDVGLIAKGLVANEVRGYAYQIGGTFQADRSGESLTAGQLEALAANGSELTYTIVPTISVTRIGIDRDEDGHFDRDELDACSHPGDPLSVPSNAVIDGDFNGDNLVDDSDLHFLEACLVAVGQPSDECRCNFDLDDDNSVSCTDFDLFAELWTEPGSPEPPATCDGGTPAIPAVSEWGLLICVLLLLASGTVVFRHQFHALVSAAGLSQ
ncbi:MAG: hypothetical protein ACPGXK_05085 [Phycisphaerae bacterium]